MRNTLEYSAYLDTTELMQHKVATVLNQSKTDIMRKRSIKRMWSYTTLAIVFIFVVENVFFFVPFGPTGEEHPGHTHNLFSHGHTGMDQKMKIRNRKPENQQIDTHRKESSPSLSKWVVVLSRGGCDVTHFTKVPGWNVVVIGNTPRGCKTSACTYIDTTKEKSLGYDITKLIPANSDGKKMTAYIYAIAKGADVIYDVECDIVPKFQKLGFTFSGNTSGLAFTGGPLFNPYRHFGYPMLYPRGFPQNSLNAQGQGKYRIVDIEVPAIQQGQINFVLGKKDVSYLKLTKDINITFDRSSPPVYLSANRYSPISSLNTVFLYKAFWALFLPTKYKVDGDVVRGYIAQRLLDEIGGSTGFTSPTAYSLTPPSGKNKFVLPKQTTERITDSLISSLRSWKCVSKVSFFECARSLINQLVRMDFLSKKDSNLFDVWISVLKKVGYKEPARRGHFDVTKHPTHWNPQVLYQSPKVIPSEILLRTDLLQSNINKQVFRKFYKVCPKQTHTLSEWLNPPIIDIMLVVIFNYDFLFQNIPYMEFNNRMYFRHILYCGPSFEGFEKIAKATNMHHFIYVNGVDKNTWFFIYQCLVHAANMKINVSGYLYIGDDLLLNTWNIVNLPRDRFWMPMPMNYIERNHTQKHWWYYWNKPVGRTAANLVLDEIQDLAKKNPNDKMVSNFLSMYDKNVKLSRVVHRSIDVFYAPAVYNEEIVKFGRIFRNHSTLLGLTVPMLHAGLVDFKKVVPLKGKSLWRDSRIRNIAEFKEGNHYLHPFKAGKDLDSKEGKKFFCDTYLTLSQKKLKELKTKGRVKNPKTYVQKGRH